MKYDIADEVAKYKAEIRKCDEERREMWRAFAQNIRLNPNPGQPVRVTK